MTVKERPILFSAPMVQAILDGRKTMTRRVLRDLKLDSKKYSVIKKVIGSSGLHLTQDDKMDFYEICPHGRPGNLLWVRETWAVQHDFDDCSPSEIRPRNARLHYAATENLGGLVKRPSIHMPRWASRILLEVTDVKIERLQDISHGDALSEGVLNYTDWMTPEYKAQCEAARINGTEPPLGYSPRQRFQHLWDSINSKRPVYSWDANPFVWVISFRRIEP